MTPPNKALHQRLEATGLLHMYTEILSLLSSSSPHRLTRAEVFALAASVVEDKGGQWAGASKIQAIHRGRKDRIAARESIEKHRAAKKLQSAKRGADARVRVKEKREEKVNNSAATKLQSVYRGGKDRAVVGERREQHAAARKLQSVKRGADARSRVQGMKSEKREREHQEAITGTKGEEAATKVQAHLRRKSAAKLVENMKDDQEKDQAASKLQSIQRGRSMRKRRESESKAAGVLQAAERGRKGRQEAKQKTGEHRASVTLQAHVRGAEGRAKARQAQRELAMRPVDPISVGDVVKAKIQGEPLWCEGIIIGRSGASDLDEFDVDFGDGDIQEHVPASSIRKMFNWDILEIGDNVKAPVPGFPMMKGEAVVMAFEGTRPDGMNTYTIKFDDDEICEGVPQNDLTKAASNRTKAVMLWKKGGNALKAVSAFTDKKWGAYRRLSVLQSTPLQVPLTG